MPPDFFIREASPVIESTCSSSYSILKLVLVSLSCFISRYGKRRLYLSDRMRSRHNSECSRERVPEYDALINLRVGQFAHDHALSITLHNVDLVVPGEMFIMRSYSFGCRAATLYIMVSNSVERYSRCQFHTGSEVDTSYQNSFINSNRERRHRSAFNCKGLSRAAWKRISFGTRISFGWGFFLYFAMVFYSPSSYSASSMSPSESILPAIFSASASSSSEKSDRSRRLVTVCATPIMPV